jgi:uncharacterized protein (TIGR02611 family)
MKRFFVALIGGTVLLIGVALLALPGPGLAIIVAAVAILATEFLWARRALRNAKGAAAKVRRWSGLRDWLRRRHAPAAEKSSRLG